MVTDFSGLDGDYTLDITALGLEPGGLFFNAEDGSALEMNGGDFECTIKNLKGHDFIVVAYRNAGADEQAVADALDAIRNAEYETSQAAAPDEASALGYINTVIAGLETGTDNVVNKVSYSAALVGKAGTPDGVDGTYIFTVTISQGDAAPTTTAELTLTIKATQYDEAQAASDNAEIIAAKLALEGAAFAVVPGRTANEEAAKAAAEGAIAQIVVPEGVTLTISDGVFTPSQPGTSSNPDGVLGSYKFTVTVDKWMGEPLTTVELTLPLAAMAYNPALDGAEESFGIASFKVFDNKYVILSGTRIYTHTSDRSVLDRVPASNTLDNFQTVGDYDPVPLSELTMKLNAYNTTSTNSDRLMNFLVEAVLGATDGVSDGRGIEALVRFPDMPDNTLAFASSAFPSFASKWNYTAYDMATGLDSPYYAYGSRNTLVSTVDSTPGNIFGIGNTIHAVGMYSSYAPLDGGGKANPPAGYALEHPDSKYPWTPTSEDSWLYAPLGEYEYFEMNVLRFDPENEPIASWYPVKELNSNKSGNLTTYELAGVIKENRFGTIYIDKLPDRYGVQGVSKNINPWRPDALRAAWAGENKLNISFESKVFDENDNVRLQLRTPSKDLIEITDYSIAKFGDTVYMQFGHPEMEADGVYELVFAWDGGTVRQNVAVIAMDTYDIADAKERSDVDYEPVVTMAKELLEGETYTASQSEVSTKAQARSAVEAMLAGMDLGGVYATVVDGVFVPAVAGSAGNPAGTDGSYTFTVTLAMGVTAPQTTAELTLSILATAYVDMGKYFGVSDIKVFDDKYAILTQESIGAANARENWDSAATTLFFNQIGNFNPVPGTDSFVKLNWAGGAQLNFLFEALFYPTNMRKDSRGFEAFIRFDDTNIFSISAFPSYYEKWGFTGYTVDGEDSQYMFRAVNDVPMTLGGAQYGMERTVMAGITTMSQMGLYGTYCSINGSVSSEMYQALQNYESFEMNIFRFDDQNTQPIATWYPVREVPTTYEDPSKYPILHNDAVPGGHQRNIYELGELVSENRFGTVYVNRLPARYGIEASGKPIEAWRPENLKAAYGPGGSIILAFTDGGFSAGDQVRLQLRKPSKGDLVEITDYTVTEAGGVKYVEFKHPELAEDGMYELIFAWAGEGEEQNVAIIAMDSYGIAVAAAIVDGLMNQAMADAKRLVEDAEFPAETKPMATLEEARGTVEEVLGGLDLDGVLAIVVDVAYTPAVAGDADNPLGISGSYTFTVELRNGPLYDTAAEKTLNIGAAPFTLTARDIADAITEISDPAKDATSLALPDVPSGYAVTIKSVDPAGVIGTDGSIIPPDVETIVTIILTVRSYADEDDAADTVAITVAVPAKTPEDPGRVELVSATPEAFVTKRNGNLNDLTITVTELYTDGAMNVIVATIQISNNAAGTYDVGEYRVYVDTKGNDQIRACYIVD